MVEIKTIIERDLDDKSQRLIARAIRCLEQKYDTGELSVMNNPDRTREYLKLRMYGTEYEVFAVMFLDNRHRVIAYEELFRGTIDGASIHPREVVKAAMRHNAAAVIFAHNHPSGVAEPSQSDVRITQRLKEALAMVDVRVLDHFIIGEGKGESLAEKGLLK